MQIKFSGVWVRNDKEEQVMSGYIISDQIIANFSNKWIPDYQRERLHRHTKISALKKIFTANKVIDGVKFHLKGKVTKTETSDDYILDGDITVLDGQQRMWALYETGIESYVVPVELYVNTDREKLIERFRNFNGAGTSLSMGDYVASFSGSMARVLQKAMKEKDRDEDWQIPINRKGGKFGLSAATGAVLLYWCHFHMKKSEPDAIVPKTRHIKNFLDDKNLSEREATLAVFGVKNLLNNFVENFGTFDSADTSYKRSFFLAFNLLMVRQMMQPTGAINTKRFTIKLRNMRKDLFNTARFKELQAAGVGDPIVEQMYDLITHYLNRGLHDSRLPKYQDIADQHEEIIRLREANLREKKAAGKLQEQNRPRVI